MKTNRTAALATSASVEKVSHTLAPDIVRRLRVLAATERLSESSVIEAALRRLFAKGSDAAIATLLRKSGATLRRKQS
ncbi:MAG: hypothetical protein GIW99_02665 [Candidatus Eremiobacteraeota bacterium]|nr:hypothetical protein [Candidatus Eremiobacteraeota bacterium]MBC5826577.1 hypothetical protein [Candidatus Eremiobacteraeota bacterium]